MTGRRIERLRRTAMTAGYGSLTTWLRRRAVRRLARRRTPAAARALAEIAADAADFDVQEAARQGLAGVRDQPAVDAVCDVLIASGDGSLTALVRRQGWLPSDPARRALMLFLIYEFDRYAELDFDGRLLASAYAAADDGIRTRLAERARTAGRPEWVRQMAQRRARRLSAISDTEWPALIGTLTAAERWDQMWDLARQAPPIWAARVLVRLGENGWRPADRWQRRAYDELMPLAEACVSEPAVGGAFKELTVLDHPHEKATIADTVVSPDGTLLAAAGYAGEVWAWQLPSGKLAGVLRPANPRLLNPAVDHSGVLGESIESLAITPDGRLLAAGGYDGTIRLWRLPSGEQAGVLTGHTGPVRNLAVTPDGALLLSSGWAGDAYDKCRDGTVRLWRLPSGEPAGVLSGHRYPGVSVMAVSPDGSLLATDRRGSLRLWRLPSGKPSGTLRVLDLAVRPSVTDAVFTPDNRWLIASAWDTYKGDRWAVRMWRVSGTEPAPAGELAHVGSVAAISPDGRRLASRTSGGVRLHLLPSGEAIATLPDPADRDRSPHPPEDRRDFTPDGRLLVRYGPGGTWWWRPPNTVPSSLPTGRARLLKTTDGALLVADGPSGFRTWRYEPSVVGEVARKPVAEIASAGAETLYGADDGSGDRALAAFAAALVRRHHSRDIELADAGGPAGAADIEVPG